MKFKEGKLDVLPKVFSSFRIEAGIAQRIARTARPTAMIPRPHHQSIVASGALLFGGIVANRIEKTSIIGFLVIFLLMFVTTTTNALAYPHPTWFKIADIGAVLLGGLVAWRMLKWK